MTKTNQGPLSQDSDFTKRAEAHPVNEFKADAETRSEANSIDVSYNRVERRFGLSAKGPLAMAALVAISVAFMVFIFYWKGR